MLRILLGLIALQFSLVNIAHSSDIEEQAYYEKGKELLYSGSEKGGAEVLEAIDALEKAILADPNYVDAYLLLGDAYRKRIFSLDFGSPEREKWRKKAEEQYRKAIELEPANPEAYNKLTYVVDFKGSEILELYNKIVRLSPDHPNVHLSYGQILESKGEIDQAISEYLLHININLRNKTYISESEFFRVSNLLVRQGRLDEAVGILNAYIDNSGKRIAANQLEGLDLSPFSGGKYNDFMAKVEKVKNYHDRSHFDNAIRLLEEGKLDEAMQEYWLQIEINPYAYAFYQEFAEALEKQKYYSQAYSVYESLLDSDNFVPDKCRTVYHLDIHKDALSPDSQLLTKLESVCKSKITFME